MTTSPQDYKKIRTEGGSRIITVTGVLPNHWSIVTIESTDLQDDSEVTLHVKKVI